MRSRINTQALRNLATTVNLSLLSKQLGISRPTLYRFLDGAQCKHPGVGERVAANLKRLRQHSNLTEIVAAGLNNRANTRVSLRSSCRGPFTKYEVLRYPLSTLEQRYDATSNTLLVRKIYLHDVLRKSTKIKSMPQARDDLIRLNLISLVVSNLAEGIAFPHRTIDCYLIDLNRIEWATLNTLCKISAQRADPMITGVVYTSSRYAITSGIE